MTKRHAFLIVLFAAMSAWLAYGTLFGPSAFERTFDEHLAEYPLAASMAAQDPALREILLRRTEAAFKNGGWAAANKALGISLATEVEIHADDAHINAISRAEVALLRDLESRPLACRAYLLAGGMSDELLRAQPNDKLVWLAQRAALKNGFERRMRGIVWTRPNDREAYDSMRRLGRGPVTAMTPAEETARAKYLDGAPELVCSGAIKESINLMALSESEAARVRRIFMANTARIDAAKVMAMVCSDLNQGWSCP
jgi:hypothetical protein